MQGMDILIPTVILLGIGFTVIYLSRRIKISPTVGFLISGIALGPHVLGLIQETETTHLLAELGVVFLLFDIGLHFSKKSAWSLRRDLTTLAPLQMLLSGLVIGSSLSLVFGLSADLALLVGLALSLSSTAVVMQVVADLKQTESPVGKTAKAVLIFQDIAAIFLLILADSLGQDQDLSNLLLLTIAKTCAAFAMALGLGRYVLGPLMRTIIRFDDPELFMVLGLLIVMLTGLATASVGLSLTLGAFLSGMVLAETPFRVLLQTELRPFRSLLLALFFITVGMMIDPVMLAQNAGTVLSLAALLIAVKGAIIGALVFVMRRPLHHVIQLTFLLAQGSEFAFVILSMSAVHSVLGLALAEQLIAACAISMLLTPLLATAAHRFSLKLCQSLKATVANIHDEAQNHPKKMHPVFIVGMNEVGKTIARGMQAHSIPYIAIDGNRQRFLEATAAGYIVAYGHADDLRFWKTLGVENARAMCIAAPRLEISKKLAPIVRSLYPNLKRYAAVKDSAEGVRFSSMGLIPVYNNGTPPGLEMATYVLRDLGIADVKIERWNEEERSAYLDSQLPTEEEREDLAVAAVAG